MNTNNDGSKIDDPIEEIVGGEVELGSFPISDGTDWTLLEYPSASIKELVEEFIERWDIEPLKRLAMKLFRINQSSSKEEVMAAAIEYFQSFDKIYALEGHYLEGLLAFKSFEPDFSIEGLDNPIFLEPTVLLFIDNYATINPGDALIKVLQILMSGRIVVLRPIPEHDGSKDMIKTLAENASFEGVDVSVVTSDGQLSQNVSLISEIPTVVLKFP